MSEESMDPITGEGQEGAPTVERTYTQADVDSIVAKRVSRINAKYQGFEEFKERAARADELQAALDANMSAHETLKGECESLRAENEALGITRRVKQNAGTLLKLYKASHT